MFKLILTLCLILPATRAFADCLDPMTIDPARGGFDRLIVHKLFPLCQEDEAMGAKLKGNLNSGDEAKLFAGSSTDFFAKMDYGITQHPDVAAGILNNFVPGISQIDAVSRMARGRNNWIVWTGGNDRFWSYMTKATLGGLDFLKTISDYPVWRTNTAIYPPTRPDRWKELGLVNDPCFVMTNEPRKDRWGLYLPKRIDTPECQDPFEDDILYPGIRTGARGKPLQWKYQGKTITKTLEVGSYYGYATGVVGLRLFPNPDFDQEAANKWDPELYYSRSAYYYDPNLVKPYRVGMSCAFCHVGPNPSRPPANFAAPKWENLNSNPGAQYFWVDRIFDWDYKQNQNNFLVQLLRTSRPGTVDTSLVSSDMINNPRTMNAVYDLPSRVVVAEKFNHLEELRGDEQKNAQFSLLPNASQFSDLLRGIYNKSSATVISPRVLKDGSDSVGALGALNRVYVNIGLFSEEWIQDFIPLIGGPHALITPFKIDTAEKRSLYWNANITQTPDLALFFLAATKPDKLSDAPGGGQYLQDQSTLTTGKRLFARNCARCHSSKLPADPNNNAYAFFNKPGDPLACVGANYLKCWKDYWSYTQTEDFKKAMEQIVLADDFLQSNYLSTELRVPDNLLDSQLCSPVATNSIANDIWDNFASHSYKTLPGIGKFKVAMPTADDTMTSEDEDVPAGGRGYLRPASLISLWSSAPYLQNNSLGKFRWEGTVAARMDSFNDSIHKLLNPTTRDQDGFALGQIFNGNGQTPGRLAVTYTSTMGDQLKGVMDVTTVDSYLKLPRGYLPGPLWTLLKNAIDREPGGKDLFGTAKWFSGMNQGEVSTKFAAVDKKPKEHPKRSWFGRFFASIFGSGSSTDMASSFDLTADVTSDEANEFINIGPIPAGTPVNLITNVDLDALVPGSGSRANLADLTRMAFGLIHAVIELRQHPEWSKADRLSHFLSSNNGSGKLVDKMIKVSRCRDFVVNRGHYFGTEFSPDKSEPPMSDTDKAALIEFLKWM